MKKFGLAAFLVISLVSLGLGCFNPNNLELRVGLGPAFWCGGDFNKALRGGNDYNKEELWGTEGEYKPLGLGYNLSAGAVYRLNPNMGLGLDLDYTRAGVGKHDVWLDYWAFEQTSNLSYSASTLAVKPSFHYGFPVCEGSFLDFFFGPAFYFGCFNFDKNYTIEPYDYEYDYTFKGKAAALGLHGGVGLSYKLNDHWGLFGSLNVEATSLKNLKDDWTFEARTPMGSFSESGTGETLWVFDYQPDGTAYRLWEFAEDEPSGPGVSNARQGSIGGPAVGFKLGVTYKF